MSNQRRGILPPVYIIVPDRFTLQAEKIITAAAPALLNVRVVTFSMLFNILHGETDDKILDKTSGVLFMWRAIRDVRKDLKYFGASVDQYAFAEKMFNTVNQLQSCMADFANLEKNANGEITRRKMHDISLIQKRYKELTAESIDGGGMLAWLIENIPQNELIKQSHIYVTGFEYLSVQRAEILRLLIKNAKSFTIGVMDKSELADFVFAETGIGSTKIAARKNNAKHFLMPAGDIFAECALVANKIRALVNGGARYRDIAVIMCNYEQTLAPFEQIFTSADIPINVDVGKALLDFAPVKQIRDILSGAPWAPRVNIREKQIFKICARVKKLIPQNTDIAEPLAEILDTIANILHGGEITIAEFNNMFCSLCAAKKISAVPLCYDRVNLINVKDFALAQTKYIFVTGASSGAFPTEIPDTDIITEQDISATSIKIEPSAALQTRRAILHAKNIINCADTAAFVSFAETNHGGERVSVTPLAKNFAHAPDEIVSKQYARQRLLENVGTGAAFKNNETAQFWAGVAHALEIPDFKIPQIFPAPKPINCAEKLFPTIRATSIENFAKCPYYHFLANGLGLKRHDPENVVAPNVVGTILHEFAERILQNPNEKGAIQTVLKSRKLPEFVRRAIIRLSVLIEKFLLQSIQQSNFKPKYFEKSVVGEINGTKISGRADRIDTDDNGNFIVIDYKSGGAGVVRLQIPFYMCAFAKDTNLNPAGGYYLNLRDFSKREIVPTQIEPAIQQIGGILNEMTAGKIDQKPIHRSICEYCVCGAMCGGRI